MAEIQPNRIRIPGQTWETVEIPEGHCGILWPLTQPTGLFYVAAESEKADATSTRAGKPYNYVPVFHGSGRWRVFYNVASTIECLLIYASDPAALHALVQSFQGAVTGASSQATMGAAAADVLPANMNRRFALIQNNGTTAVRIRMDGTDPTTAVGIRLEPGDSLDIHGDELVRNLIRGIAESGAPVLDIIEGT